MQRHAHRRLPGHVEQGGERGVALLPLEVGRAVAVGVEPAQRPGRHRADRRQEDVEVRRRPEEPAREQPQREHRLHRRLRGHGQAAAPQFPGERPELAGPLRRHRQRRPGQCPDLLERRQHVRTEQARRDVVHPVPEVLEQPGGVLERPGHLRLQFDAGHRRLQVAADPQRPRCATGPVEEGLPRRQRRSPRRIAEHRPRHGVEHRGGVPDRPGQWPVGAETGDVTAVGGVADPAAAGLDAEQAVDARRDADRAAAVAALREGHHPGRHRDRRAAAGPAGQAGGVPRATSGPDEVVVGVAGETELGRVRLAQADGAGGRQLGDDGVVHGRDEVGQDPGAERRPDTRGVVEVLDRRRDAEQRRQLATGPEQRLRPAGRSPCVLRGDGEKGPERRVQGVDPPQRVLDELGRAHLARPDGGSLLERGQIVQPGHGRKASPA